MIPVWTLVGAKMGEIVNQMGLALSDESVVGPVAEFRNEALLTDCAV